MSFLLDDFTERHDTFPLMGLVRADKFARGEDIVFIHTGGAPATFAYADAINDGLAQ